MLVGCSFGGANRLGEDHDIISTDRSSGGLVSGRSHDSHGSNGPLTGGYPPATKNPNLYGYYGGYHHRYYAYYPVYPAVAGYWDYYRTDWPGRGNNEESTR